MRYSDPNNPVFPRMFIPCFFFSCVYSFPLTISTFPVFVLRDPQVLQGVMVQKGHLEDKVHVVYQGVRETKVLLELLVFEEKVGKW